jgi:hypothetical protein
MFQNKRKIDSEHEVFREQWENDYFFIKWRNKGMCLICKETITVLKEYNIKRHYKIKHKNEFKNLVGTERAVKCNLLKKNINTQSVLFKKHSQQDVSSVRASYLVARAIANENKLFSDGEFVKECMLRVINAICPEKKCLFEQISLSRSTIARNIEELGFDIFKQVVKKAKTFSYFSIALYESSDMINMSSRLLIFIRGVNDDFEITEELGGLASLSNTKTGDDIFKAVSNALENLGLGFENLVSVTTDGGKSMMDTEIGLIGRINTKMSKLNLSPTIGIHCIVHQQALLSEECFLFQKVMSLVVETIYFLRTHAVDHYQFREILLEIESEFIDDLHHSNVPWLNKGTILKHFFFLRNEIKTFLKENNKLYIPLYEDRWLWDLALLTDITHHLNILNLKLQENERLISNFFGIVKAFQHKLSLFKNQFEKSDLSHFECCATLKKENCNSFPKQWCITVLFLLKIEYQKRFKDILDNEELIKLFENPINIDPESIESSLQLEIIDLQSNNYLKTMFQNYSSSNNLIEFYSNLSKEDFPNIRQFAAKISCMFGSTYICEQVLSSMKISLSKTRFHITNEQLHAVLRLNTSKVEPNIDVLSGQKQGQQSH